MKQIVFALPVKDSHPIGGYKIIYQYADFLSSKGYDVHFVYSHVRYSFFGDDHSFFLKIKTLIGFYTKLFLGKYSAGNWFSFKNKISKHFVFKFDDFAFRKFRKDSILFATAVETSYPLAELKKFDRNNIFYFIQDYEKWHGNTDEYLLKSYSLGLKNIVIANWLKDIVEKNGASARLLPNGLDFTSFHVMKDISNRNPKSILLLYHKDERKGLKFSFKALEIVKNEIPDLKVCMFGTPDKPSDLPDYFDYYQTPSKEKHLELYNDAAIFISSSLFEGWGLTVCEAMQCGCAIACTDAGGFKEFAADRQTALISPVEDPQRMAANIIELIKNDSLRIKLAKNANENIQRFTLENSYDKLLEIIGE